MKSSKEEPVWIDEWAAAESQCKNKPRRTYGKAASRSGQRQQLPIQEFRESLDSTSSINSDDILDVAKTNASHSSSFSNTITTRMHHSDSSIMVQQRMPERPTKKGFHNRSFSVSHLPPMPKPSAIQRCATTSSRDVTKRSRTSLLDLDSIRSSIAKENGSPNRDYHNYFPPRDTEKRKKYRARRSSLSCSTTTNILDKGNTLSPTASIRRPSFHRSNSMPVRDTNKYDPFGDRVTPPHHHNIASPPRSDFSRRLSSSTGMDRSSIFSDASSSSPGTPSLSISGNSGGSSRKRVMSEDCDLDMSSSDNFRRRSSSYSNSSVSVASVYPRYSALSPNGFDTRQEFTSFAGSIDEDWDEGNKKKARFICGSLDESFTSPAHENDGYLRDDDIGDNESSDESMNEDDVDDDEDDGSDCDTFDVSPAFEANRINSRHQKKWTKPTADDVLRSMSSYTDLEVLLKSLRKEIRCPASFATNLTITFPTANKWENTRRQDFIQWTTTILGFSMDSMGAGRFYLKTSRDRGNEILKLVETAASMHKGQKNNSFSIGQSQKVRSALNSPFVVDTASEMMSISKPECPSPMTSVLPPDSTDFDSQLLNTMKSLSLKDASRRQSSDCGLPLRRHVTLDPDMPVEDFAINEEKDLLKGSNESRLSIDSIVYSAPNNNLIQTIHSYSPERKDCKTLRMSMSSTKSSISKPRHVEATPRAGCASFFTTPSQITTYVYDSTSICFHFCFIIFSHNHIIST